jgi:hypothetical protein
VNAGSWFTALLLVAALVFIADSATLSPLGRLAPLCVLVPTAAMTLVQLVKDIRGRGTAEGARQTDGAPGPHEGRADASPAEAAGQTEGAPGAGGPFRSGAEAAPRGEADKAREVERHRRQLRFTFWIAGLAVAIYLLGFLLATTAFLLLYLRTEAGAGWRTSLLLTAATVSAIHLAFTVLADLRFPEGALF